MRHGKGIYINFRGKEYNGSWKNDQQNGFGIETDKAGAKYEGYY